MPQARLQPSAPISIVWILMLAPVAIPSEQRKVRAMIRPNKVSEILSIGSSTLPKGVSDASDILENTHGLILGAALLTPLPGRRSKPPFTTLIPSMIPSIAARSNPWVLLGGGHRPPSTG